MKSDEIKSTGSLGERRVADIQEFSNRTRIIITSNTGVNDAQLYDVAMALKKHRYKIFHEVLKITMENFDANPCCAGCDEPLGKGWKHYNNKKYCYKCFTEICSMLDIEWI